MHLDIKHSENNPNLRLGRIHYSHSNRFRPLTTRASASLVDGRSPCPPCPRLNSSKISVVGANVMARLNPVINVVSSRDLSYRPPATESQRFKSYHYYEPRVIE